MDVATQLMLVTLVLLIAPVAMSIGCSRNGGCSDDARPPQTGTVGEKPVPEAEKHTNRLADESSLYLQLHAHNPVDWYPWGDEALEKAKAEDKPIFLSIGYSSCYWCHVMERESFMDEEVAAILNEHFVCIKVDREERPDIDEIYMASLQVYFQLIGSPQGGGWPLTMFLTPEGRPMMGGTYFPPRDKQGVRGLIPVLDSVRKAWDAGPDALRENSEIIASLVERQLNERAGGEAELPGPEHIEDLLESLSGRFDADFGGFTYNPTHPRQPKFPEPSNLVFLLNYARENEEAEQAVAMLSTTLDRMAQGGIRDHLGGGFHRYSTDRFWAVPHFEKMLYDNGQLASIYAEAYLLTGNESYAEVTSELLDFVLREMLTPEGAFASAIDAETDAEEGLFYVWQREELIELLSDEQVELLAETYGIGKDKDADGRNVLLLPRPLSETAKFLQTSEDELQRQLAPIKKTLFDARANRERPLTDTKILTAWNGLMIRGLADGGRAIERQRYITAAQNAARFVLENLRDEDGRLKRSFGGGKARLGAYLDDYAFFIDGLIALYEADGDEKWLAHAQELTDTQIELFWDEEHGGFFFTAKDHEKLIARSKDPADSVLPSGNAISAENLIYLGTELDRPGYLHRAEKTITAFATQMTRDPATMPRMAVALSELLKAN